LSVDARGGTFSQRWQVYAESWVALPGNTEYWPRDVRINGAPAPVVAVNDVPNLRLKPGSYTIAGRFEWSSRPESLPLAASTAIVDLVVDGSRVAQPERPDGGVWLGKRRSAEQAAAMEVQVYRLVQDQIPVYLLTRIRLNVAGEAREETLGRALPEGFIPVSMRGDLPARLERDGTLRVQLRAGSHEIALSARGPTWRAPWCGLMRAANGRAKRCGALKPLTRCALRRPKARKVSTLLRPMCRASGASTPRFAWMLPRSSTSSSAAAASPTPMTIASR
jgi:hypothetical protein